MKKQKFMRSYPVGGNGDLISGMTLQGAAHLCLLPINAKNDMGLYVVFTIDAQINIESAKQTVTWIKIYEINKK